MNITILTYAFLFFNISICFGNKRPKFYADSLNVLWNSRLILLDDSLFYFKKEDREFHSSFATGKYIFKDNELHLSPKFNNLNFHLENLGNTFFVFNYTDCYDIASRLNLFPIPPKAQAVFPPLQFELGYSASVFFDYSYASENQTLPNKSDSVFIIIRNFSELFGFNTENTLRRG